MIGTKDKGKVLNFFTPSSFSQRLVSQGEEGLPRGGGVKKTLYL